MWSESLAMHVSTYSGLVQRQWLVRCLILIDKISVTAFRQYLCALVPHILTARGIWQHTPTPHLRQPAVG